VANTAVLCDVLGKVSLCDDVDEVDVCKIELFNCFIHFATCMVRNAAASTMLENNEGCMRCGECCILLDVGEEL